MAGGQQTFDHQSMFWSDVGQDVGFEATGIIDSKLPTHGVYPTRQPTGEKEVYTYNVLMMCAAVTPPLPRLPQGEGEVSEDDLSKGVVFYLSREERKVVGVLTWNLFGKMDVARKVCACVRACVRVCVCACTRVCARACACVINILCVYRSLLRAGQRGI